jgi:hypothetical protein
MHNFYVCLGLWWPPLWSSGQSSWLHIQRSGFNYQHYQIFWEVVDLERSPLSLVSTIELLERKSSGSSLENWDHGHRDPSRWPRGTLYTQKLALTSLTSSGHSAGIIHSQTQATEFFRPLAKKGEHIRIWSYIKLKNSFLWDIVQCSLLKVNFILDNTSPISSGSKNKLSKKPIWSR